MAVAPASPEMAFEVETMRQPLSLSLSSVAISGLAATTSPSVGVFGCAASAACTLGSVLR